jgi:hypothetical protein
MKEAIIYEERSKLWIALCEPPTRSQSYVVGRFTTYREARQAVHAIVMARAMDAAWAAKERTKA